MKPLSVFGFLSAVILFFFSCQKELSQESNSNTATFSLQDDSTKQCLSTVTVNGHYYNGVSAKRDTNYIQVVVNVKSTGSYNITSSTSNGFYFSDSGFFSKIGFDTLILSAKGTPILIEATTFSLSDTTCGFTIDVQDSTGTGLGGVDTSGTSIDTSYVDNNPATDSSWHFTDSASGQSYTGTMSRSNNSFIDSSGIYVLTLPGLSTDLSEIFGFKLYLSSATLSTGVYPITGNNSLGVVKTVDSSIVFISNELLISGADSYSYIKITSYDATTKHIEGSFHCWAIDSIGTLHLLKGSFNTYLP